MEESDKKEKMALVRYQVISPLIADPPQWGEWAKAIIGLSEKLWQIDEDDFRSFSPETIRRWLRLYMNGGFDALKDKGRGEQSRRKLPEEVVLEACRLKEEVPERTIEKIIRIMEEMEMVPRGLLKRSTLHRELKKRGMSMRRLAASEDTDLMRFEAHYANDLWQADMLTGPWIADPDHEGKMRRAYLFAFLDDASRLLLYGRFFFKGDLPALELVFKRAIRTYGVPRKAYFDNGKVFRSRFIRRVCAILGIRKVIFTRPYRPMGHGKIEAFNRICTSDFIAEVKASHIRTLDDLNRAFYIWMTKSYNERIHSEIGISPRQRWLKDAGRIRYVVESKLRDAFMWEDTRTPDKCGVLSIHGLKYEVSYRLARKKVCIRYDLDNPEEIEVWSDGRFQERAHPLETRAHRPPQVKRDGKDVPPALDVGKTDYLGHIVKLHEAVKEIEVTDKTNTVLNDFIEGMLDAFRKRVDPHVMDEAEIRSFFRRFGPYELDKSISVLDSILSEKPPDLHISYYLETIRDRLGGDQ